MRCSPFVCLGKSRYYVVDVRLTNPNNICISCNEVYLLVLKSVIEEKNIKKVLKRWKEENTENAEIIQVINDVFSSEENLRKVDGKDKGWAPHALYVALYCLLNTKTFNEGIDRAILFGGDTDTNAAITGALIGAKYGYSLISTSKRQMKNISILKRVNANINDIDDIAEKLSLMFDKHRR